MLICYTDDNDCDFAIELLDDSKAELACSLISEGISAWYGAAHDTIEPTEHYTVDDIKAMYNDGYAEPACALLDRFEIPYTFMEFDENVEYDINVGF